MTARFFFVQLVALLWGGSAWADKPTLSEAGTLLGRVHVSELSTSLRLTVDLSGDVPQNTYVTARFQNNRPQQRIPGGDWQVWNEQSDSLKDNGFLPNEDGTLTFDLVTQDLTQHFLPIIFTVSYRTENGFKSGYVVIDP